MMGLYPLITVNSRHRRAHSAELHWSDNDIGFDSSAAPPVRHGLPACLSQPPDLTTGNLNHDSWDKYLLGITQIGRQRWCSVGLGKVTLVGGLNCRMGIASNLDDHLTKNIKVYECKSHCSYSSSTTVHLQSTF